ncbi:MAG: alpha/beta hydrolase [Deltaproteobacteria bacterium]|nr:alpha/beta hydrolase [Deltaproteobacteria bacterium]
MTMSSWKNFWRPFLLAGILLPVLAGLALAGFFQAKTYDYPIADPIKATILGTPASCRPPLPKSIRAKQYQTIEIFPDRQVPDVFWYSRELRFAVAYHKKKAPLIFMIAGTGAGYDSAKMKLMQKIFYQAGFHVVSISSPTHPNFIVSASEGSLPGDIRTDAADLYRVMKKMWQENRRKDLCSDFYLTGYSLGGSEAAFVAQLDEKEKFFNFRKVLMINPALNIYDSAVKMDRMLADNIPGGLDHFDDFYRKLINSVTKSYVQGDFVDLSGDFFYHAYSEIIPNDQEGKALIGFAFRISLANMLFTADVMTDSGYLVPKNLHLSRTDSFAAYARDLLYPAFKAKEPGLTFEKFVARSSLRSIEDYLRHSQKIGLVTNADDFILAPGDTAYFKEVFGDRARIYPRGGHCGNLGYRDNVEYMINFLKDEQGRQ